MTSVSLAVGVGLICAVLSAHPAARPFPHRDEQSVSAWRRTPDIY